MNAAAKRFSLSHTQQASLTLLLPAVMPDTWKTAGDAAAARMLIATLACEWGSRALRVDALEVPADIDPPPLFPLLRCACG